MPEHGFAYLAYPIDQAGGKQWEWVEKVAHYLQSKGWGSYDPGLSWTIGAKQRPDRRVMAVNNMALGRCDALVAFLPPGIASIGTPIEIDRAVHSRHPVAVLGGIGSWALARYEAYDWVRVVQKFEPIEAVLDWMMAYEAEVDPHTDQIRFAQVRDAVFKDGWDAEELPGRLPTRAYDDDAGLDLYVSRRTVIHPGQTVDVPCNIAAELPEWSWGLLVGRSSTTRTKQLQVHPGVIDSSYRGELFAQVTMLPQFVEGGGILVKPEPVVVEAGERLAQLIVLSNATRTVSPVLAQALSPGSRGDRGFGSSGR